MCDFISWIEFKSDILFLTYHDIFETERGKELRVYCQSADDLIGHGAIRWYYDIKGGKERECTDFSTPANFPERIIRALKNGEFSGLAIAPQLLEQSAWAEYEKVIQPALAEYDKVRQSAWAEYDKVRQSAWAEYEKVRQKRFWGLFETPENRIEAWREAQIGR